MWNGGEGVVITKKGSRVYTRGIFHTQSQCSAYSKLLSRMACWLFHDGGGVERRSLVIRQSLHSNKHITLYLLCVATCIHVWQSRV